jgi:hypothetical protein
MLLCQVGSLTGDVPGHDDCGKGTESLRLLCQTKTDAGLRLTGVEQGSALVLLYVTQCQFCQV